MHKRYPPGGGRGSLVNLRWFAISEGWKGDRGWGVIAAKISLSYKFSSVVLIHIHCCIKFPAYFISPIKQKHVLIIIGYFATNNCHVHMSYIHIMCLIP